jgi:hypothetical protein
LEEASIGAGAFADNLLLQASGHILLAPGMSRLLRYAAHP